jgi:nucleotide-binding universal stress UspA family protein
MNHRMLVTVDDTTESLRAAATAARLSVDLQAQVRVLTVIEDDLVGEELDRATSSRSLERRRQAATNLLEFVRNGHDDHVGGPGSRFIEDQVEGLAHGLFHLHPGRFDTLGADPATNELEQVACRLAPTLERLGTGRAFEFLAD